LASPVEECCGNIPVVDCIEEAELTDRFPAHLNEVAVDNGGDAAYRPAIAPRQKQLDLRVFEERIAAGVEAGLELGDQWWDPRGMTPMKTVGETDKIGSILPGPNRSDYQGRPLCVL